MTDFEIFQLFHTLGGIIIIHVTILLNTKETK